MSAATDRLAKRATANPLANERVVEIEIPLGKIRFDPTQPRKAFHHIDGRVALTDEEYINELAESIRDKKLIHAVTVQEMPDDTYLVVVGECRTRAHLKLGLPTIRAVVRNDLIDPAQRLLYQLAENVNRKDLTDIELAESIRHLMKGSDAVAPMSQVQIAGAMGKSEGWVSRFVKFGDEENQRVWVKSGIADTVEKVYRLSILPVALQMDIQRRAGLPKGDPDRLDTPLQRDEIDRLKREAKVADKSEHVSTGGPGVSDTHQSTPVEIASSNDVTGALVKPSIENPGSPASDIGAKLDVIGQAFADAAVDGRAKQQDATNTEPVVSSSGTYQLPEEARANILGLVPTLGLDVREATQPPVDCRLLVKNVLALADILKAQAEIRGAFVDVWCDVKIPGQIAQLIANELMGFIVDTKEVPATLQNELTKVH